MVGSRAGEPKVEIGIGEEDEWFKERQPDSAREMRAEDGGEMGAYHHLLAQQRVANLQVRLDEYLRFGLEAGIFFVS